MLRQESKDYTALPYLTGLLGLLYIGIVMLNAGCTSIKFETTTKDGSIISAHADSFLWDRQIKGFTFDYQTGTVTLESFSTNPDKESIGKLCETVQTLVNAIPK
jgi:hypothetical protein